MHSRSRTSVTLTVGPTGKPKTPLPFRLQPPLRSPSILHAFIHAAFPMRATAAAAFSLLTCSRLRSSSPTRLPSSSSSSLRLPLRRGLLAAMATAASFRPEAARSPPAVQPPAPPLSKFKVAMCQLSVTADKARNIARAREAIETAAAGGAKLVLLPEIWNGPYSNDSFPEYAEDIEAGGDAAPSFSMMSEVARSLQITLVGGSISERSGNKLYNTCCVFGSDGELKGKHRKIHLFDIDIPGKITFKESKTLTAGQDLTVVDTDVGRIGIGIGNVVCCKRAIALGVAAKGKLFVATCAPARDTSAGYIAWGHSTLVGPFGEVIATAEHEETTIMAEIDYSLIDQRRQFLPLQYQRRGDLYQLIDVQRSGSDE
uniref:CN hydrolase domain-containing protein n=1 Tax=Oryza punctata TaxID=4537 RepID=A0A0E0K9G6_ORYPU